MDGKLMLQMTEAVSSGRLFYLSVPLTTGPRDVRLMKNGETANQEPRRRRKLVFDANKREAWVYAHLARARFPTAIVVDPSTLDNPSWGQDEYNSFWADLITEHASAVLAAPGWAFSRGARLELDLAVRLSIPVITLDGVPLDVESIAGADQAAGGALSGAPQLAEYLVPMSSLQGVEVTRPYTDSPVVCAIGEVFGWLRGERAYQLAKFGVDADDRHTAAGLDEDQWWWRQLTTYLHRGALGLGVQTPGGRQALAKYAATACGLAESVLRCFGGVWPDGPVAAEGVDTPRPGREADALFRWLIGRRAAVLDTGEAERDDGWLDGGLDQNSPWWHDCMATLRGAQRFPLQSPQGRRAVGEIVLRSCALNEAVSRRYGPLPPPGVPSGYGIHSELPV